VHTSRVLRAFFFSGDDNSQRHSYSLALNRFNGQSLFPTLHLL
jgi:hypothetical protein